MLNNLLIPSEKNNYRSRILENDIFIILLLFLLGLSSFNSYYLGADIFQNISKPDLYELINSERVANGLLPLKINTNLEGAANLKLNDMFQNNYFSHNSPLGTTPWYWFDKVKYNYRLAGENLAMNFSSTDATVKAWMASDAHRQNILLNDFNETGIAFGKGVINGRETIVVVQVFGSLFNKTANAKVVPPASSGKSLAKPIPKSIKSQTKTAASPIPSKQTQKTETKIIKTEPISLQKVLSSFDVPNVGDVNKKIQSMSANNYVLKNIVEYFTFMFMTVVFGILMLKIFVVKVRHPWLIAKGLVLVGVAVFVILTLNNLPNLIIK